MKEWYYLVLVCGDSNTWKHVSICIIDQWGGLGTIPVDTSAVSDLKQMAPTKLHLATEVKSFGESH